MSQSVPCNKHVIIMGIAGMPEIPIVSHFMYACTGCDISIRTVGVASKPVQPRPLPFAGFFIYVKRKFVANLKVIGSLMWK